MRKLRLVAGAVAVASLSGTLAQAQSSLEQDAVAFGTRESVTNMDLSPDGRHAVFLGAGPGRTTIVYVADLAAGTTRGVLTSKAQPESLQWCFFVSDQRLACRYTLTVASEGGYASAGILIPAARTISAGIDGSDIKELGQPGSDSDLGLRQYDGNIIDWLAGDEDPNTVLMTRLFLPQGSRGVPTNVQRSKSGLGVVRLNVQTLKTEAVEGPRSSVDRWMSDGQGHVRLIGLDEVKAESQYTGRTKYLYRSPASRDWIDLVPYQKDEFYPLAIDASINSLYALRKRNGRFALTRVSLDQTPSETIVAENPRVDIDSVVRVTDGQRVVGYTYTDEYRHTVYFDPEYKALSTSLSKALPGQPAVTFVDSSLDGSKILVLADSDHDAGRFYLFDKTKKSMGELMPVRTTLAGRQMPGVKTVSYTASDGTAVPAYLTLPVGKPAKALGAVILPHGGPSSRDYGGFDWLAQFLAARGYAVFQPQYRGSGGFGDKWLGENGFKGWRTSIADITAATRYLVREGIADPNKLAILGWSYGGYAALQSAATEPSLYKAVIAIAPVTDFEQLKDDNREYSTSYQVDQLVGGGQDALQGSPLRRASAIQAPVLLAHGDLDINVGIPHSDRMNAALQRSGKQVEYLRYKGLDHQLEDSAARTEMLTKIGQLLERTIGR